MTDSLDFHIFGVKQHSCTNAAERETSLAVPKLSRHRLHQHLSNYSFTPDLGLVEWAATLVQVFEVVLQIFVHMKPKTWPLVSLISPLFVVTTSASTYVSLLFIIVPTLARDPAVHLHIGFPLLTVAFLAATICGYFDLVLNESVIFSHFKRLGNALQRVILYRSSGRR